MRRCDLAADFPAGVSRCMDVNVVTSGANRGELSGIDRCVDRRPVRVVTRILGEPDRNSTIGPCISVMQMGGRCIVGTACVGVSNECAASRIDSDREGTGGRRIHGRHLLVAFKVAESKNNSLGNDLAADFAARIRRAVDIDVSLAGKQRGELCRAERRLFGKPVSQIAAILSETDLDRTVETGECAVQMRGRRVVEAVSVDVQSQQGASLVQCQRSKAGGSGIDRRYLLQARKFRNQQRNPFRHDLPADLAPGVGRTVNIHV